FATYRSPPARTAQVEDRPNGSQDSTARCQPVRSAARTCSAVATAPIMAHPDPGARPIREDGTTRVGAGGTPPVPPTPTSRDTPGRPPQLPTHPIACD